MELDQDQSDEVEDRRGEQGRVDPAGALAAAHKKEGDTLWGNLKGMIPSSMRLKATGMAADAGANDIPQYADGGGVDGDNNDGDGEGDSETGTPAIPTDDQTSAPDSMGDGSEDDGTQQPTQAPSVAAPIPNQPQAPNPVSELMALVRAINQYGLHIAQQKDAMGPQQPQQQQVQGYSNGGVIRSFEEGGSTDDDPEATPAAQPQQAQPAIPTRPQKPVNSAEAPEEQTTAAQPQRMGALDLLKNSAVGQQVGQIGKVLGDTKSSLMNYFRGEHAMDGQTKAAIDYSNNKDGSTPGNVVAQKGVQSAYIKGLEQGSGDARSAAEPARAYLQAARREYDMWRTAAAAKLQGGDVGQAIELANKAFSKGPFDNTVTYKALANGQGVTGLVTDENGNLVDQHTLPMDQFASWLQKGAKFDGLVHDGISATVGNHVGAQQPQYPRPGYSAQQQADANNFYREKRGPITVTSGFGTNRPEDTSGQSPQEKQLQAQAARIFPNESQRAQRAQWVGQMLHQQASASSANERLQDRITDYQQRLGQMLASRKELHDDTEANKNARQEYSWKQRLQMAHDRLSNGSAADKNKAFILQQTMKMHPDDNDAVRQELARQSISYDELIGAGSRPAGQPQGTPQAGGTNSAGAPQGGTQGGARPATLQSTAAEVGLKAGDRRGNMVWNGGPNDRIGDKTKWTKSP